MLDLVHFAEKGLANDEPYVRRSHHPSSAAALIGGKFEGRCRRQQFYSWMRFAPSDPATAVGRYKMSMGRPIQRWFLDLCARGGLKLLTPPDGDEWKDRNIQLPGCKETLSAAYDNVGQAADGRLCGIECKSTGQYGLKMIRKEGPKIDHLMQCLAYMKVTGIDNWMLVYIEREPSRGAEDVADMAAQYWITISGGRLDVYEKSTAKLVHQWRSADAIWEAMAQSYAAVEAAVAAGRAPPRDYSATWVGDRIKPDSDWPCRFCDYRRKCWL